MQGGEGDLGASGIWCGRRYCLLHVLCSEQGVLVALGAARFAQAGEQLGQLTALLGRFPHLLRDCVPGVQMLLGAEGEVGAQRLP